MQESRLTVYAALGANLAISAALFSEGIHSIVDSGDSLLLLLGLVLSKRGPSREHPYGQGELVETIHRLEDRVRERHPLVHRLSVRFL